MNKEEEFLEKITRGSLMAALCIYKIINYQALIYKTTLGFIGVKSHI